VSPSGRIHWFACNKNPARYLEDSSFFYRALNPAQYLQELGYCTSHSHWKNGLPKPPPDLAIFHRPRDGWGFRRFLKSLQKQNIPCFADVDDLIFDPALAGFSPGVRNSLVSEKQTRTIFNSHFKALQNFSTLTVSTQPLAVEAQRCFPSMQVEVVPNAVAFDWANEPVLLPDFDQAAGILGYFPGTRSHDRDFAMLSTTLCKFLEEFPDWKLRVAGPLSLPAQFPTSRIEQIPKLDFSDYKNLLKKSALVLAPLETTRFNECKSALKIIEAGAWGIPAVAAPIPDMQRFAGPGVELPVELEDWLPALRHMAETSCVSHKARGDLATRIRDAASLKTSTTAFQELIVSHLRNS
jgi:glycosyltransferase involved in cell wall biosynthesis